MANDSLRTPLCVTYRAEAVACGIIFTAARKLKVSAAALSRCCCPCCICCMHQVCAVAAGVASSAPAICEAGHTAHTSLRILAA